MLNLNSNSTLMDAVAGLEDAKQLEARELDFLSDTETDSDQSQQDVSYMTSQAHLNQISVRFGATRAVWCPGVVQSNLIVDRVRL